jgi:E3 ubiquitin-protein ligase UBR1
VVIDPSPTAVARAVTYRTDALSVGHTDLFVLPPHPLALSALLADGHARTRFHATYAPEPPLAGRPCVHIFTKGNICFRCKCVIQTGLRIGSGLTARRDCALDDSCVMCARCFHASAHEDHDVSFFVAR